MPSDVESLRQRLCERAAQKILYAAAESLLGAFGARFGSAGEEARR